MATVDQKDIIFPHKEQLVQAASSARDLIYKALEWPLPERRGYKTRLLIATAPRKGFLESIDAQNTKAEAVFGRAGIPLLAEADRINWGNTARGQQTYARYGFEEAVDPSKAKPRPDDYSNVRLEEAVFLPAADLLRELSDYHSDLIRGRIDPYSPWKGRFGLSERLTVEKQRQLLTAHQPRVGVFTRLRGIAALLN